MPTSDIITQDSGPDPSVPALEWRIHLLKRQPTRLPILLLALLFGVLCTGMIFRQPLPVVVVLILLISAVAEYLFPITYQMNEKGVTYRYGLHHFTLLWSEVKRIEMHAKGVLLSPLPHASRRDNFRGIFVRFAKRDEVGNRTEALTLLSHYLPNLSIMEILPSIQQGARS